MAIRVHVAAALSDDMAGFQREICVPQKLEAEASGPWLFATASVWNMGGGELDAALGRLSCPTLRTTTVDGALWELHLRAPDRDTVALSHSFNLLSGEMVEELECYESVEELVQDGWLNEEQASGLARLAPAEAMAKHAAANNEAILAALARLSLPGDAGELRAILEGESVTAEELSWDVGNLPRFLSALGLDGPFGDWRQEIEDQLREREEQERAAAERPPDDLVAPIEQVLSGIEPAEVEGGPVAARLQDLVMAAWSCERDIDAGVRVTLPAGATVDQAGRAQYPDMEIVQTPGSLRIGTHDASSRSACVAFCSDLSPLVQALPDGAIVELLCAEVPAEEEDVEAMLANMPDAFQEELRQKMAELEPDERNEAGDQIYAGEVRQGVWQVSAAYPAVSAADLSAARDLLAAACDGQPLPVSDEEAEVVMEAAAKAIFLDDDQPVHRDGALVVEESHRYLAALIFRQRFGQVWDVAQAVAAELADWEDLNGDAPFDLEGLPPQGEELLQGTWSVFHRAEMIGWQGLSDEDVAAMDAKMKDLGLQPLGDLVAEAAGPIVLRGYGAAGATLHATWMVGAFDTRVIDLFTTFAGGGSLTTTTNPMAFPDEAAGVYKVSHPDLAPAGLRERHDWWLEKLAEDGREPAAAEPDLLALARSIDEFMS